LGLSLIILSAIFYLIHYAIFRDAHHIFFYLIGDIAFVLEVLLVTLIIHQLLSKKEKHAILLILMLHPLLNEPWVGHSFIQVDDSIHTHGFLYQPQTPVIAMIKEKKIITEAVSHFLIFMDRTFVSSSIQGRYKLYHSLHAVFPFRLFTMSINFLLAAGDNPKPGKSSSKSASVP